MYRRLQSGKESASPRATALCYAALPIDLIGAKRGGCPLTSRSVVIAATLLVSACSGGSGPTKAVCSSTVLCGFFDIAKTKESTAIFFAGAEASPPYRLCVEEGSIILQTIEADGNAQSIGGEIRAGNCADASFSGKVYIIGNTAAGKSSGFYYRLPQN